MKKLLFTIICIGLLFTASGCGDGEKKIAQLEKDVKILKSGLAEKNQEIAQLKKDVSVLKSGLAEKNQEIAQLKKDVNVLKIGKAENIQRIEQLEEYVNILKRKEAAAAAAEQNLACQNWSDEAETEYKNGNFQKAVDLREKVVQQDGCDEALRAKNQYLAGYIYLEKLNDLDKAKDAYQKVIDNYASSKYVAKAKTKLDALQQAKETP
ncbi:MAG: hypothetical protein HN514_02445, partial [Candidatus Marinimicrobia bacterium]|nr:hypothetical protein [Candidatus Neomarinimicrobiota bacterium]